MIHRQAAGDGVLGGVGVLVLVDEHEAEAGVELGPQLRVVLEGQGRPEQQVVEIEGVGVAQLLLVDRVNAGDRLAEEVAGPLGVALGRRAAGSWPC